MREWRDTILGILARQNGTGTLRDIYTRLERMNVLSPRETRKTRYGSRPAYQHTARGIIHDLYRAGYLRQLSRGRYTITARGRSWKPSPTRNADIEANKQRKLRDEEVDEGLQQDKTIQFRQRNAAIITKRKKRDNYTCQACRFRRVINGVHIIDCHHTKPLARSNKKVTTHIEDLVCLCPNCHRIAHNAPFPLSVQEIRAALRTKT